jgi:phage-related protein
MEVRLLPQCEKEIKKFPPAIKELLLDAIARLREGINLSMPLSRPMPSIGKGVHELRLKEASGIYRIVYVVITGRSIYLIHGFKKTSQKTPLLAIELARTRIKGLK